MLSTMIESAHLDGTACGSCGGLAAAGFADCRAMWDHLLAESFSNFAYARFHRPIVDAYSLQHPDEYCRSAKSYVAHLTGMCVAVEHGGSPRLNAAVQRWLSTNPRIEKPPVPDSRGVVTAGSVLALQQPAQIAEALGIWFAAVWNAYEPLHPVTHEWIRRHAGRG